MKAILLTLAFIFVCFAGEEFSSWLISGDVDGCRIVSIQFKGHEYIMVHKEGSVAIIHSVACLENDMKKTSNLQISPEQSSIPDKKKWMNWDNQVK